MVMKTRFLTILCVGFLLAALGGCSSIAKGVTEAVLEREDEEDMRQCEIQGPSFDGIRQSLDSQTGHPGKVTKVLMVHGISDHVPGYSSRFQKRLYEELGLTRTDATTRMIELESHDVSWAKGEPHTLGFLQITNHTDAEGKKRLMFFELTWSPILSHQKQVLASDSANNEGLSRADLNASLKSFMNATVPDLLIYMGNGHEKITTSVREAVCWMLADQWQDLPKSGRAECGQWPRSTFSTLAQDDHFFVTHSLGSRITIDTIQNFKELNDNPNQTEKRRAIRDVVRDKSFTVFMLANQLPLLQMGTDVPETPALLEQDSRCGATGKEGEAGKNSLRVMKQMNIVAFSDPNDILSYPVPFDFAEKYLDRRICPIITNVSLNVAPQKNLFDTVSFANPLEAHSGYLEDARVIDLIANGLHHDTLSPLIGSRCAWQEVSTL